MDPMISRLLNNNKLPSFSPWKSLAAGETNMSPYIHRDPQVYWMPQDIGVLQRRWVAWFVIFFAEKKVGSVSLFGVGVSKQFFGGF